MGDISIMARRIEGGKRVQYGWSGNGGYYIMVGARLLYWYDDPEMVEYLFNLGQLRFIGKPGSENGGEAFVYTHSLDGQPHWLGRSEREIFSQIAFIDYGYFYDLDNTWYYIIPGPFRIKIPLIYIDNNLDKKDMEFDEREKIIRKVASYILTEYYESDREFQSLVNDKYPEGIKEIRKNVLHKKRKCEWGEDSCYNIWEDYNEIFKYFDDWVVAVPNDDMTEIVKILVQKNQDVTGIERLETINW